MLVMKRLMWQRGLDQGKDPDRMDEGKVLRTSKSCRLLALLKEGNGGLGKIR